MSGVRWVPLPKDMSEPPVGCEVRDRDGTVWERIAPPGYWVSEQFDARTSWASLVVGGVELAIGEDDDELEPAVEHRPTEYHVRRDALFASVLLHAPTMHHDMSSSAALATIGAVQLAADAFEQHLTRDGAPGPASDGTDPDRHEFWPHRLGSELCGVCLRSQGNPVHNVDGAPHPPNGGGGGGQRGGRDDG